MVTVNRVIPIVLQAVAYSSHTFPVPIIFMTNIESIFLLVRFIAAREMVCTLTRISCNVPCIARSFEYRYKHEELVERISVSVVWLG